MLNFILSILLTFSSIDVQEQSAGQAITVFSSTRIISDSIPALNKKVLAYTNANIGKKVGRGECWDLAAEALKSAGAKMKGVYVFGRKINPAKEAVYPGDIIQFEKVKLTYTKDKVKYTELMPHHTAVIYAVTGHLKYDLAHQNTSLTGKKVGISDIDLNTKSKGKFYIYRPEN
jgi:hypothetical protein